MGVNERIFFDMKQHLMWHNVTLCLDKNASVRVKGPETKCNVVQSNVVSGSNASVRVKGHLGPRG